MIGKRPPGNPASLIYRSFSYILPLAGREWRRWRALAQKIPDDELRKQAIASLQKKRFHAEGGCVFAVAMPRMASVLVPLIVALQTISDYLDNLCDRSTSKGEADFAQLHLAMAEAVTPGEVQSDYYAERSERDDGGYLAMLVGECRENIVRLPRYGEVADLVRMHIGRYNTMQTYKHVDVRWRKERLQGWYDGISACEDLSWWEFSAAAGSTLCVFALFLEAANPRAEGGCERVRDVEAAYFPWVCGLHILLDYLIDQEEDLLGGDLNFVAQYTNRAQGYRRMELFAHRAREAVAHLSDDRFHSMVIAGLLGMYLSDEKVDAGGHSAFARGMIASHGTTARLFRGASRFYRRVVRHH